MFSGGLLNCCCFVNDRKKNGLKTDRAGNIQAVGLCKFLLMNFIFFIVYTKLTFASTAISVRTARQRQGKTWWNWENNWINTKKGPVSMNSMFGSRSDIESWWLNLLLSVANLQSSASTDTFSCSRFQEAQNILYSRTILDPFVKNVKQPLQRHESNF